MSDSDSFISEVAEEVRRDRFYSVLRRYGWLIALVVVAIVGGTAWREWSQLRDQTEAQATGAALRQALNTPDPAERAAALAALATGPSAPVAQLAGAGALLEADAATDAGALLATLAADTNAPELYRSLAALQRVMSLGDTLEPSERLATLDGLAADGAPFRLLALEQRALARIETGDTPGARADLETIMADLAAPEGLRGRAQQLFASLGGGAEPAATPEASEG